jgi:hypothetical protein
MQWHSIGHEVVGKTIDGRDKKVSRFMYNDTRLLQLIDYLKLHLSNFVVHNFIVHWQEKEFKRLLKHIPKDTIVSCIDFENYAMKVQNEIQDMHWFFFQVTVLVHITFKHNRDYDPIVNMSRILKEVHYYVFDEKKYNALFV